MPLWFSDAIDSYHADVSKAITEILALEWTYPAAHVHVLKLWNLVTHMPVAVHSMLAHKMWYVNVVLDMQVSEYIYTYVHIFAASV